MAHYKGTSQDGDRARSLANARDEQKAQFEKLKQKSHDRANTGLKALSKQFIGNVNVIEDQFKASTVGLVSAADFKAKRKAAEVALNEEAKTRSAALKKVRKRKRKEREKKLAALSFDMDEEEGEDDTTASDSKKKKMSSATVIIDKKKGKDPSVDTYFLPDKEREEEETRLKNKLTEEWNETQGIIKKEKVEITYSYWDGSGHRRGITVDKGTTIDKFLEQCRRDLCEAFHELRGVSSENLMYIKEDLIIPHHYSFYDLIVTKARGKSGPLFHFDVHDDVRLLANASIEKDESHAGKIVTRAYYERNQHIFPVNRWEVYDPSKTFDKYTIS